MRLAAQRILAKHLNPGPTPATPVDIFWEDIDIDLTSASLVHWSLENCQLRHATFDEAQFTGNAWFNMAQFTGNAVFTMTQFAGVASFNEARFAGSL